MKRIITVILTLLCLNNGIFGKDFEKMSLKEIHETFLMNTHIYDFVEKQLDHSYVMRHTNHYMKDPTKKEAMWNSAYNGKYDKYEVESSPYNNQLYILKYWESKNLGYFTRYPEGSFVDSNIPMTYSLVLSKTEGYSTLYRKGKFPIGEDLMRDLLEFDLIQKCKAWFGWWTNTPNVDSIMPSFEVMVNNEICLEYDLSTNKKVYYYKSTGYLAAIQDGERMDCFLDYQKGFDVYVWPMTHFVLKNGQPYIEENYLDVNFNVHYSPEHFTKHKMK